jgi:pantoate--beta-alanine ligase
LFRLESFAPLWFDVVVITINTPSEMQKWALAQKRAGRTIGFVPTMGYLHEGHLSLIRLARRHASVTVVSIFVNPKQFGPKEDFGRYPRDFARDEALCRAENVDVIFYPDPASMYAENFSVYVVEESLGGGLCGASRPGHFRGVTTVVAKLFNIVQPDFAVFGEKDAQQLRIVRRMVRDMNFPVTIIPGPIARETDGLAMSSRNSLLQPEDRRQAVCLSQSLEAAVKAFRSGERDAGKIRQIVSDIIGTAPQARVDYIEVVDDDTLAPVNKIDRKALLAIAVFFSTTRLIDNVVLGI